MSAYVALCVDAQNTEYEHYGECCDCVRPARALRPAAGAEKENFPDAQWEARGSLTPVSYTRRELYAFFDPLYNKAHEQLDRVETIYRSDTGDDNGTFYLVMQTDADEVLIAEGYDMHQSHIRWLYRMEQVSGPYDADYLDASLVSRLSTQVKTFSLYETDTAPGYVIAGFLSGEGGEMTDMGFAVFQLREGRCLLADCYVYLDAAVVRAEEAIDSRIYDGILLAADPAVCTLDVHSSKEEKYEVLLINHPQISAVTRTVDGIAGETAPLTACPAMLVFPWEDIDTREYHFTYAPAAEALLALPESSLDTATPDSLTVPARTIWKTNSLAQITTFMMWESGSGARRPFTQSF